MNSVGLTMCRAVEVFRASNVHPRKAKAAVDCFALYLSVYRLPHTVVHLARGAALFWSARGDSQVPRGAFGVVAPPE